MKSALKNLCLLTFIVLLIEGFNYRAAIAQSYPTKPIIVVLNSAPGSSADVVARLLSPILAKSLGQPVVLENHSGSGGSLGLSKVARSAKDGYTLGLTGPQLVIVPSLYKLPYDVVKDLTTISIVADTILVLVVNADLPVRNVDELVTVAKARENSKTLTFGSQGIGTVNHLSFEMFRSATNINVLHVPYKGSDGFTTALVSGEIDSGVLAVSQVLPWVKSGKLRILSIVSSERTKLLPDTPTMAELGYKDAQLNASLSFIAPTGTPREIIDRLNHEISNTLKMSEVQSVLNASGFIIGDGSNSAAADMKVKQDTKRIANVISRLKLKPE